jgi:hypothetical protein
MVFLHRPEATDSQQRKESSLNSTVAIHGLVFPQLLTFTKDHSGNVQWSNYPKS